MKNYAIIENDLVVNLVLWDGDDATWAPDASQSALLIGQGVVVGPGYTYVDGVFVAPPAAGPTDAELWAAHQALARAALDASDITAIRCMKAGAAFPPAWLAYCVALRAVISAPGGDPSKPLPEMPAYPAGT